MHPPDEEDDIDSDLEDDFDEELDEAFDDDDWEDDADDDEGTGGGRHVDQLEERENDEDYEPDEEDKDAGWYEDHFGGPDDEEENDIGAELENEQAEDYEYEEGGGIVTDVPLTKPVGRRRYQNVCWKCSQPVDDKTLPRCETACGWVQCKCGSCLCDMPLKKRLKKPHTVKIMHITAPVQRCPGCRGVCFVPSDEERRRKKSAGQDYAPDLSQYSRCGQCGGKGYLQA